MAERIDLEVPATLSALSTVRMVVGGLGARLDFSLDDLDDLYLATGRAAAQAALDAEDLDRLRVERPARRRRLRVTAGDVHVERAARRRDSRHAEDCLDLCMLLRSSSTT